MINMTMTEMLLNALATLAIAGKNKATIYEQKVSAYRQGHSKVRNSAYTPHQGKRECARRKKANA